MHTPTESQFTGCLIGQCLGDALGFPVEGRSRATCTRYVQEVLRTERAFEQRRGRFRFGQYSDDSQLARELLISFVHQERFDPQDYAGRIAALFVEKKVVGRGQATTKAAFRIAEGVPWDQAGTPAPEAGNGSAMRAGPVGLLFWHDPALLIRAANDQGRITHQDPRCTAGAVAIAGAVALVIQEDKLDREPFLQQLAAWTQPYDPILADALEAMEGWVDLPPEEAFEQIAPTGLAAAFLPPPPAITPFVTASVLWSLYAFLRHPDDYLDAIGEAIAVGGDVDTTAAMTGAISGARLGLEGIPSQLAERLNDQGEWGYEELVELARRVYGLVSAAGEGG